MGSSKKHKDKAKKRKHRSRSESVDKEEKRDKEREGRHHHKKHHKEKRKHRDINYEPPAKVRVRDEFDVEDGEIEAPPPPRISLPSRASASPPPPPQHAQSESRGGGSGKDYSLSIEEANRIRAKLGLKPLAVGAGSSKSTATSAQTLKRENNDAKQQEGVDMGEFVHKPATNITVQKKTEKLKSRLTEKKEKRRIESKLSKVRTLAEDSDGDDVSEWVLRNRKIAQEKEKAEKRAKILEELDQEFGVSDLVTSEFEEMKQKAYTNRDLQGLRVEHSEDRFNEGRTVILTLKDKGVLDEDDDALINVNLLDEERYEKSVANKKLKAHLHGYNVYDEADMDDAGNIKQKDILDKYDEEIKGPIKKSFVIGEDQDPEAKRQQRLQAVRSKLRQKTLDSLNTGALTLANEYYTPEEMVTFKKPKKKRKVRTKVLKADDLLSQEDGEGVSDLGSRSHIRQRTEDEDERNFRVKVKEEPLDGDELQVLDPEEDLWGVRVESDELERDLELALSKARKLKQLEQTEKKPSLEKVANLVKKENEEEEDTIAGHGNIILNATAEFCRSLGDIPTYGLSGNREDDVQDLADYEREILEDRRRLEDDSQRGAWNEVEIDKTPVEVITTEAPILDEEPDVGSGVAAALKLAVSKGYLEKENSARPSASRMQHLQAQNYSIEDKTYIDDDKFGRRERYSGPTMDFKEKETYRPNVKLEYIDDDGRLLSAKEAFRYLSHKFHGKGPGKNKIEKRLQKVEQEGLMKQMSSTDTPLGTLTLLQQKQKETQSPFVVLSGNKTLQSTSIAKPKH